MSVLEDIADVVDGGGRRARVIECLEDLSAGSRLYPICKDAVQRLCICGPLLISLVARICDELWMTDRVTCPFEDALS